MHFGIPGTIVYPDNVGLETTGISGFRGLRSPPTPSQIRSSFVVDLH
jgi:hypothetical protein